MTDNSVEQKRPVLIWLLVIVGAICLVVFYFFIRKKRPDVILPPPNAMVAERENNITVNRYIEFVRSDTLSMSIDHQFTREAFTKLILATKSMAKAVDYKIIENLDDAQLLADHIVENQYETTHADDIRKAAELIATVLKNLQLKKYISLETDADKVIHAAEDISPRILALDQKEKIKLFFTESANILKNELKIIEGLSDILQ